MTSLHFCLRSLGQFVNVGPIGLVAAVGHRVLDVLEADADYKAEMARIEAEEAANLRLGKIEAGTRRKIEALRASYQKRLEKHELDWAHAERMYQRAITKLLKEQRRGQ